MIKDITLLSKEEYEKYKNIIPNVYSSWWLKGPRDENGWPIYVNYSKNNAICSSNIYYCLLGIRPVLIISDFKTTKKVGEKIPIFEYSWTILDINEDEMIVLCDKDIYRSYFDSNDVEWENSKTKQHLVDWLDKKLGDPGIPDALFAENEKDAVNEIDKMVSILIEDFYASQNNIMNEKTEDFSPSSKFVYNVLQLKIFKSFVKCENLGCYSNENGAIKKFGEKAEEIKEEIIKELGEDSIKYFTLDETKKYFEIGYDDNQVIQIWINKAKLN